MKSIGHIAQSRFTATTTNAQHRDAAAVAAIDVRREGQRGNEQARELDGAEQTDLRRRQAEAGDQGARENRQRPVGDQADPL
ncbi:MAG: hypothetical protein AAFX10_11350 [Pseudomonadota bacterium]